MSISHRVSIAWESDDFFAEEPTNTLVLTTPSGWFVDTRIRRAALQGPTNDHKLQSSDIDWAFAGKSISTPLPDGRRHAKWIHWVDDHVALTDPPAEDEGIMSKIEQEPRTAEMEREEGSMRNPATGNVERYVEIWRDTRIVDPPVPSKPVENGADAGQKAQVPVRCIVMQCDEPEKKARGMMIKLGQHVMGVLKVDEHLFVERYTYADQPINSWERVCYLRTASEDFYAGLPAESLTRNFDYGLPEYHWQGLTWKIIELGLA